MKYSGLIYSIAGAVILMTLTAGIIRHDVSEKDYLNLAKEKQFDCVGEVLIDNVSIGSCVLISDQYVLTAAHVVIKSATRPDTMIVNGKQIIAYERYDHRVQDLKNISLVFNGKKVNVNSCILHPYYLDSLTRGSCDIAILGLDQPLPDVTPANINAAFDEANADVVGVGYGASGPANRPHLVDSYNKKIAGQNVVDSIGGKKYGLHETILMCDFDHPKRKDCNKMGSPVPRQLEYICSGGDSGGGLFRIKDDQWELIGICAGGGTNIRQLKESGYYGQIMKWTRVSVFQDWIREHTNHTK